jgi:hypothetical protein
MMFSHNCHHHLLLFLLLLHHHHLYLDNTFLLHAILLALLGLSITLKLWIKSALSARPFIG